MKIKEQVVPLLFILFSVSIAYSQNVNKQPASCFWICFDKFIPDSINNARINEILSADSLFIKGHSVRISSFEVYVNTGPMAITERIYGNRLSKRQKLLISGCRPGQLVYIQNIMVKYPAQEKVKINSKFIFKIKSS